MAQDFCGAQKISVGWSFSTVLISDFFENEFLLFIINKTLRGLVPYPIETRCPMLLLAVMHASASLSSALIILNSYNGYFGIFNSRCMHLESTLISLGKLFDEIKWAHTVSFLPYLLIEPLSFVRRILFSSLWPIFAAVVIGDRSLVLPVPSGGSVSLPSGRGGLSIAVFFLFSFLRQIHV